MKFVAFALVSLAMLPVAHAQVPNVSKVPAGPSPVPVPYPVVTPAPIKTPVAQPGIPPQPIVMPVTPPKAVPPPTAAPIKDPVLLPQPVPGPKIVAKPARPTLTPLDNFPAAKKDAMADGSVSSQKLHEAEQQESRKAQAISNASAARHDAAKNAVQNIR